MPPLHLYARVRFYSCICTRDRGCSAHPAFPAPSFGGDRFSNLGPTVPREGEGASFLQSQLPLSSTGSTGDRNSINVIARSPCDEAIHSFFMPRDGLLRTPLAHSRDLWLAM